MDQTRKLMRQRQRVLQVLQTHVEMKGEPVWIQSRLERDERNDRYRLIDHNPRANGGTDYVIVELMLRDGKVWILRDGIEYGIAEDLQEAGIAPENIVMHLHAENSYPLTAAVTEAEVA